RQGDRNLGLQSLRGRTAGRRPRRVGGTIGDSDDHRSRAHRDSVPLHRTQGDLLMVILRKRKALAGGMGENRRFWNLLPHIWLWIGIAIVAFPVYLAFVGSTHEPAIIANGQMPLTPGAKVFENYYRTIFVGTSSTTREPVGTMLVNSFVMAMAIACGKIAISIL